MPIDTEITPTEKRTELSPLILFFDRFIKALMLLLVVGVPLIFSFELTTYTIPKVVLAQVLVCFLLAAWFLKMTILGKFTFVRSMLFFPILIYFLLSVLSLTSAISLPGGISLLWQIFAYILVYFIVIHHIQEREIENWALIATLVGLLVSGYGILQYVGIEPLLKGYSYIPYSPFSTLGHRNQVAQYLILLIPLSGVFFFFSRSWVKRIIFGVSTPLMIYHLFITKSRGGILGLLLAIVFCLCILIYKRLVRYPFFDRKKWLFLLLLLLFTPLLSITFPRTMTLKVNHINPIGYYVHSIDGSKIRPNETIRIEFDYRVVQGDLQKPGYLNLLGERTNSPPVYLSQRKEGWDHIRRDDISFSSTPYDEDLKLRWVPGSENSTLQLKHLVVQTGGGVDLIKDPFLNRLFSRLGVTEVDKAISSQARLYMYRNTIEMIKDNFFLGAGFGNFKYVYPHYRDRGEWALSGLNTRVEQAHSEYLQIFSEVGVIGLAAFLWILVVLGQMGLWMIRNADTNRSFYVFLALNLGIVATLIQSFFDFNLQNPASGVTFWMVTGFLELIYCSQKENQASSKLDTVNLSISSKKVRWIIGIGILAALAAGIFYTVRPLIGDGYVKRGRLYAEVKRWDLAFFDFERASFFSPYNFDVYFHLGQVSEMLKNYDRSVNDYKRAIALHPYFIEARNNLGAVYIKMGMIDEAIEEFRGSIEINPYHPGLHNNLGYLYSKKDLLREALKEYQKTLELDPGNPEVHKNLGLLYYYKLKDYPKAKVYWEKYLVLNPGDPQNEAIRTKIEEIKKEGLKSAGKN